MVQWGSENNRRRPTLPRGFPRSTIGAEELNFRVRDGNGCDLFAMATEILWYGLAIEQQGDLFLYWCIVVFTKGYG